MIKSIASPSKYYQGSFLLSNSYRYLSHIGRRFVIIADNRVKSIIENKIKMGFQNAGSQCVFLKFNGESSLKEISRLSKLVSKANYSGIIGAGGGKAIDTAKLVGDMNGLTIVTVPTSAANDAACTSLASVYTEDGHFVEIRKLRQGPAVVLADTDIIANAPVKFLISGIGQSLATFYEARACNRSGIHNYSGGTRSNASLLLAKLCRNLLFRYGPQALKDIKEKRLTKAVEAVIEANIYLSGLGFENNGCAATQGIYSGMTIATHPLKAMHGEGIAFSLLVQLILEYNEVGQWNNQEWGRVLKFYKAVGLPRSFKDLQIDNAMDELLQNIAIASCKEGSNIYNMPFEINKDKVYNALEIIRDMDLE